MADIRCAHLNQIYDALENLVDERAAEKDGKTGIGLRLKDEPMSCIQIGHLQDNYPV